MTDEKFEELVLLQKCKTLETIASFKEAHYRMLKSIDAQMKMMFLRPDLTDEQKIEVIKAILETSDAVGNESE